MAIDLSETAPPVPAQSLPSRTDLASAYREVRATTESLCAPLEIEDYVAQSMPDASPAKWHLAHTSWFFETFILGPESGGKGVAPSEYAYLFNSYYNALGERITRDKRGLCTRPTVAEVHRYRALVDERMLDLLETADDPAFRRIAPLLVIGLNHEQQHQELTVTDLKHLFSSNPVRPTYRTQPDAPTGNPGPLRWVDGRAGMTAIGHDGDAFAFDNETPRHRAYLQPHRLANRLVTNRDYLAFLDDDGYKRPEFWLSDGWYAVKARAWESPLYWDRTPDGWQTFTLGGMKPLDLDDPVCHVSFFEADAFARWSGSRLPTEFEWESAAESHPIDGHFLESGRLHPRALPRPGGGLDQLYGDVWEWTSSPYIAYPGYRPASGALGEYNGKFMCNQFVLRGGSCATPRSHIRPTYRNFFPADARWQFSGIRLAQDV